MSKRVSKFRRLLGRHAFTLSEVMISVGVGSGMLAISILSSVDLMKRYESATQYRNLHENARQSMAIMSKDIRSFQVMQSDGTVRNIRYSLSGQRLLRNDQTANSTIQLTDSVTSVLFERWNNPGQMATSASDTYEVRVYLTITNSGLFTFATDLLQTRVLMRNKP
jgi:type II secretory pathway component PulJ